MLPGKRLQVGSSCGYQPLVSLPADAWRPDSISGSSESHWVASGLSSTSAPWRTTQKTDKSRDPLGGKRASPLSQVSGSSLHPSGPSANWARSRQAWLVRAGRSGWDVGWRVPYAPPSDTLYHQNFIQRHIWTLFQA